MKDAAGTTTIHGRKETILIVEDEPRSQRLLRLNLEPLGYAVITSAKAAGVLDLVRVHKPPLIVLDLRLPDGNGFDLCQQIRRESAVPIIILSAYGQLDDKLRGFEVGADDYLTKPYDAPELAARIDAVLRRTRGEAVKHRASYQSGPLTIEFDQQRVTLEGRDVALTRTEYRLLEYLAVNAGRPLIADAILANVWGMEYMGGYASLHLYISRVRRKLGDDAQRPRWILTKAGIGYMMASDSTTRTERDVQNH